MFDGRTIAGLTRFLYDNDENPNHQKQTMQQGRRPQIPRRANPRSLSSSSSPPLSAAKFDKNGNEYNQSRSQDSRRYKSNNNCSGLAKPDVGDNQREDDVDHWLSKIKFGNYLDVPDVLMSFPYHVRNDKRIVLAAVQRNGDALKAASPQLQNDEQVVVASWLERVKIWGTELGHAPFFITNNKKVVMAAVKSTCYDKGKALKHASSTLQNDIDVVMAAVENDASSLQYASPTLQNDKRVVMLAVKNEGSLEHASPELQDDKDVVIAAAKKNAKALEHASPKLQDDDDVIGVVFPYWLSKVSREGGWLGSAPRKLRSNRKIVMAAVQNVGWALKYASPDLRMDKEVVLKAVQAGSTAIQYASPQLQSDKAIILEAVAHDGYALQFALPDFRKDKPVVLAAVRRTPDAIKYVHDDLKLDKEVLIAAGMFDNDIDHVDAIARRVTNTAKIVLSTRFSLEGTSNSEATNFTKLLKQHTSIQNGGFKVYAPNANYKGCCDPSFTDFNHPCRGTNCKYDNKLTEDGRPTDDCCWRYSFRSQLQEAKDTGGFMLQLVESEKFGEPQTLGKGQRIELDMANAVGTKVFLVLRPTIYGKYGVVFTEEHIDIVTMKIALWYYNQCQDMSPTVIGSVCTVYGTQCWS